MMISTKGRYALRVMMDLADQQKAEYIPLKVIAKRQNISKKYLEKIMVILSKNNFIEAVHGKGGGYRLNREPADYKVGEILRLAEGKLTPVAFSKDAEQYDYELEYRMIPMWDKLDNIINDYLDSVSIADLVQNEHLDNYVI